MNAKVKSILCVVFLSTVGFVGLIVLTDIVSATTTIQVGPNQTYKTIQAAVNFVQSDNADTAYIIRCTSNYVDNETGPITISWTQGNTPNPKSLSIQGITPGRTNLATTLPNSYIFYIHFDLPGYYIEISYFEFTPAHDYCQAIYAYFTNNIIIHNCSVIAGSPENFDEGFYMDGGTQLNIRDCDISDCIDRGIQVNNWHNSNNYALGINNNFISNLDNNAMGLYLSNCCEFCVEDNYIHHSGYGIVLKGTRQAHIFSTNLSREISNNSCYGILIDDEGIESDPYRSSNNLIETLRIVGNVGGGIKVYNCPLESCQYNEFKNLIIDGDGEDQCTGNGIEIIESNWVKITGEYTRIYDHWGDENCPNLGIGIYMENSEYVNIDFDTTELSSIYNIFDNYRWGIYGNHCNYIYVKDTVLRDNGIYTSGGESGHIKMYQTTTYEIGGNSGDTSFIGLEDSDVQDDNYGVYNEECYDGWIKDIEFNMETQTDCWVFYVKGSEGIQLGNIYNSDSTTLDNGICIDTSTDVDIYQVALNSVNIGQVTEIAVKVYQSSSINIGIVDGYNISGFDDGIHIDDCDGASSVIIEADIDNCTNGIAIYYSTTGVNTTYAVELKDRVSMATSIKNCTNGIYVQGSSAYLRDFYIYGAYYAIYNEDGVSNNDNVTISNTCDIDDTQSDYDIITEGSNTYTYEISSKTFTHYEIDQGTYIEGSVP